MMTEIWKDVVGFEGRYQVSNLGRVRSKDMEISKSNGRNDHRKGKVITPYICNSRYTVVGLTDGEHRSARKLLLHRVVAKAFVDNPNGYSEVDHLNGDRNDNRACNLKWVTHKQNMENPVTRKNLDLGYKLREERRLLKKKNYEH